jgi:tocopherol O-methyltransferase
VSAATTPYTLAVPASAEDVRSWYERKTCWLLDKYGPGLRVHFHTGLVAAGTAPAPDALGLRAQLVAGQEALLERASQVWDSPRTFRGQVLDVGCGLGGSALYFASNPATHVTALSNVAEHLDWVSRFAAQAGLGDRVDCTCSDAHELGDSQRFDAVYSIGASNYFDRPRWFQSLARVVKPGGTVGIEDTFKVDEAAAGKFDAYWLSSIGTRASYEDAAAAAGFELLRAYEVSDEAARWYDLSVAHSHALLRERALSPDDVAARQRSISWQAEFAEGYRARAFEDWILCFRKTG